MSCRSGRDMDFQGHECQIYDLETLVIASSRAAGRS